MKYIETAVEIKRLIEFHNTKSLITKFCLLGMFFTSCCAEKNAAELVLFYAILLIFCYGAFLLLKRKFHFSTIAAEKIMRNFILTTTSFFL